MNWEKAVTIHHPVSVSDEWKEREQGLNKRQRLADSVSKEVPTIDWDHYLENANDKAAVAKIRAEYENYTFPPVEGENLDDLQTKCNEWLEVEESVQDLRREMVDRHKQMMLDHEEQKRTIHTWRLPDYFRAFPHMQQELIDEAMRGEWIMPKDLEAVAKSINFKEWSQLVKTGRSSEIVRPSYDLVPAAAATPYDNRWEEIDAKFEKLGKLPTE